MFLCFLCFVAVFELPVCCQKQNTVNWEHEFSNLGAWFSVPPMELSAHCMLLFKWAVICVFHTGKSCHHFLLHNELCVTRHLLFDFLFDCPCFTCLFYLIPFPSLSPELWHSVTENKLHFYTFLSLLLATYTKCTVKTTLYLILFIF